jgi:hypothetical protein
MISPTSSSTPVAALPGADAVAATPQAAVKKVKAVAPAAATDSDASTRRKAASNGASKAAKPVATDKPAKAGKALARPAVAPVDKKAAKPAKAAQTAAPAKADKPAKPVKATKVVAPASKVKVAKPVKAAKPAADAAPAEPHKVKLVRDSFTMPELEYTQLSALKRRALTLAHHVKKSELLRAGVATLAAMNDETLLAALQAVPPLKTGRPKSA